MSCYEPINVTLNLATDAQNVETLTVLLAEKKLEDNLTNHSVDFIVA